LNKLMAMLFRMTGKQAADMLKVYEGLKVYTAQGSDLSPILGGNLDRFPEYRNGEVIVGYEWTMRSGVLTGVMLEEIKL